ADLKHAGLFRAYLRGADLRRADLRGADLSGANLREANLKDALATADQLASAILDETTLLPDGSNPKGG
ncbi:MAG: pentapeptide repeat-containing protein, partial [Desulfobacterales bacterium]|nr:pentapeptide repeat-containing protein [Desulfobacterales bacterium]